MKWKDSGEMDEREEKPKEDYFDEEQFSPWAEQKAAKKGFKFGKPSVLLISLVIAIVALIVILLALINGAGETLSTRKLEALEERIQSLEERLDKYTSIDEKVTRIWEQAKSFEKFKDRFDRTEASMSLRMDHLTMSLETLQKQLKENPAPQPATSAEETPAPPPSQPVTNKMHYHEVSAGDTLYSISKKYNLSVDELRKLNHMEPNSVIVPGQKLIVQEGSEP